jgi:CubicO group peptidase (beta-lactamase class C family)
MRKILCILVASLLLRLGFSQLTPDQQTRVDSVFQEWNHADKPGCALVILKNHKIIYQKGYGMADLEHGIGITPNTVFYAGSISKQFVAASILLLAEQKKLDMNDEIHRYFPNLPDYGEPITIRHLIHHISGIKDYFNLLEENGKSYLNHMDPEEVLELIFSQDTLDFLPGEKYQYSNSGYLLLAEIVGKVSGTPFSAFVNENIFQPLEMHDSRFHDDVDNLIPNRAWGYLIWDPNTVKNILMRFDLVGSGGLYTNVLDLAKWDHNFYDNQLGGGSSFIQKMETKGVLNDGSEIEYAYALAHLEHQDWSIIGHTGSLGGYRAVYFRYPREQFSVIILSNAANYKPSDKARSVAEILLTKK